MDHVLGSLTVKLFNKYSACPIVDVMKDHVNCIGEAEYLFLNENASVFPTWIVFWGVWLSTSNTVDAIKYHVNFIGKAE